MAINLVSSSGVEGMSAYQTQIDEANKLQTSLISNPAKTDIISISPSTTTPNFPSKQIEEKRKAQLLQDKSPLTFPEDLSDDYYIEFNAFTFNAVRNAELKRTFNFEKSIYLPLPQSIGDNFVAEYNEGVLNTMGQIVKEVFEGGVEGALSVPNFVGRTLAGAAEKLRNTTGRDARNVGLGMTAGALGGAQGPLANAAKVNFRVTENPFPVMTYSGTGFKQFQFEWLLYPESKNESEIIKKIVGYFRREMLPERFETNRYLLKYPAVFEIRMHPDSHTLKFKRAVLVDLAVNYAPTGVAFINSESAELKAPAAVAITMKFKEIEIWLANDFYNTEEQSFDYISQESSTNSVPPEPVSGADEDFPILNGKPNPPFSG